MEHARPPSELSLEGSSVGRADAWKRWKTQFLLFLKASGVHKEEGGVQASLLINLIGAEGFDVYETFTFDNDAQKDDVTLLIKKFDDYFGVKQNITLARYNFFMRNQESGESIDQYLTALKLLSKICEFKNLEEELIRDRIVCGIQSIVVRDRLLRTDDLNLDKAVKICQAHEISKDSNRVLETRSTLGIADSVPLQVNNVGMRGGVGRSGWRARGQRRGRGAAGPSNSLSERARRAAPAAPGPCLRCGGQCVDYRYCPANTVQCYICEKRGHYARMCNLKNSVKKLYNIEVCEEEIEDGDCESFFISALYNLSEIRSPSQDWCETLQCIGGSEMFKLDTGADINVLAYERFKSLGYNDILIKFNKNVKLQSYSGDFIPIKGTCNLKWYYKNIPYELKFAISVNKCQSVLGLQACINLGLIKRIYSFNLKEYDELFSGLGCLPGEYHIVYDKAVPPVICAPRKVPLGLRDKLQDELNRMVELNVIRKVTHPTPWVNSLVIVAKKNGQLRICLDPRPLNRAIQRAHFHLPTVNELATKLQGAKYFSVLDANSGFWALKLDDASADLCTFSTPFGRYQYLRLPFGLNCAPEVFHAKIKQYLEGLEGVDCFIDDIICWGKTKEEHDMRLKELLNRAREINLKFKKDKCLICVQEVTYLGHIFNASGMKVDTEKVKAIKNMPEPNDRKSLERFLGMTNYLAKFIPNYSEHIFPLTRLLKKDTVWHWDVGHKKTFEKLKQLISDAPVLSLYNVHSQVLLSVDASSTALGAVLMQDGRPVEYASRTLTDTQQRYAQIEKEMLAIVFACQKFHQYIYGKNNVIIESDHKPLESIFKKPLDAIPARLQRMMLRIQGYDLVVTYKPGKYMYIPDTLSRAPLPDLYEDNITTAVLSQVKMVVNSIPMSLSKFTLVKKETCKDRNLMLLLKYIQHGWPDKFHVSSDLRYYYSIRDELYSVDNVIFKNKLVLIPFSLQNNMLKLIHEGHLGIDRCKRRARDVLFWPGITKDIENYVRKCKICEENSNKPSKEPMIPIPIPNIPWNKIGTDIFEYGKKKYLILVDYFSGFIEVGYLRDTSSNSVINILKENFARYGIPETVISDNGPQFTSRNFAKFVSEWDFCHVTSSPRYAQSNGKSERAVQTVKKMLKKTIDSKSDFYLSLLSYRNTPRENLNSPAQLMMGRRLNSRLPVHYDLLKFQNYSNEKQYENLLDKQIKTKFYYDQHCKPLPELNVGDDVLMLDDNKSERIRGKVVAKASTPRSYFIKNKRGIYRRNRRHLTKSTSVGKISDDVKNEYIEISDQDDDDVLLSGDDEDDEDYEPGVDDDKIYRNSYSPPCTRSRTIHHKQDL